MSDAHTKKYRVTAIINNETYNKRTNDIEQTLLDLQPQFVLSEIYLTIKTKETTTERRILAQDAKKFYADPIFRQVFMNNLTLTTWPNIKTYLPTSRRKRTTGGRRECRWLVLRTGTCTSISNAVLTSLTAGFIKATMTVCVPTTTSSLRLSTWRFVVKASTYRTLYRLLTKLTNTTNPF